MQNPSLDTFPRTGIHKHVRRYIENLSALGRSQDQSSPQGQPSAQTTQGQPSSQGLKGKNALDIPAGDGRATYAFIKAGATVTALDLFPEFLKVDGVKCVYADMQAKLPVADSTMDYVVSQEGIEHVSDQYSVFCEFNRVLRPGGEVLLTTPNMSNMRTRLSMFLTESDYWKRMPASELDSIWFSSGASSDLYFGHLFCLNIQKVRALAAICGFRIKKVVRTDISFTSLWLTVLFYPVLALASVLGFLFYLRKNPQVSRAEKLRVFGEQIRLNLNFWLLAGKHIFVVLVKERELSENVDWLKKLTR